MKNIGAVIVLLFLAIIITDLVSAENPIKVYQNSNNNGSVDVKVDAEISPGHSTDSLAFDLLVNTLSDESWIIRMDAACALGYLNDSRAVDPLIQAIRDPDCDVRIEAARALGNISDPKAEEPLIPLLNDTNVFVRTDAARALEKLKSHKATDYLIQALKSNDSEIRARAAESFCFINNTKAAEPLLMALKDNDTVVRSNAAHALGYLKCSGANASLIEALDDNDSIVKTEACWALGELREKKALDSIANLLDDRKWYVRAIAVEALGKINDNRVLVPLIKALNDEDPTVRSKAATSLGMSKSATAIELLKIALNDENEKVRASSAIALFEINMKEAANAMAYRFNFGTKGLVNPSQADVFAPTYAKKVVIRADDIANNNSFVMYLSNLTMEKGFKTIYAVVPVWLDRGSKIDNLNITYFQRLDKGHFELATHGYDHISFEGKSYTEQLELVKNSSLLMEKLTGWRPSTFVPPFHSCDLNTTKACSAAGYHSISSGHVSNQAYIENFGAGFMWETDWDTRPVTISSFRNFVTSFNEFYNSTSEFLVILLHPKVIFQNSSGGFNQKNMELFEYSIDYMTSKGVDYVTIEEAHQWKADGNAIRMGKVSSNIYVVDMTSCFYNHTIKLNSAIEQVMDISTGDSLPMTGNRSFEGVKGMRYEVILVESKD